MAESIRKMDYFAVNVPNKRGEGTRLLRELSNQGVNLVAFTGFPSTGGKAQLDFVPENSAALRSAAERIKLKLKAPKTVFIIQGEDRKGAIAGVTQRLAEAKINVIAVDAVSAGNGSFAAMLWVKPKDVDKAAAILGAT
jgi:hypothetical protein